MSGGYSGIGQSGKALVLQCTFADCSRCACTRGPCGGILTGEAGHGMADSVRLTINTTAVIAAAGQRLLDVADAAGAMIARDCGTGLCENCRVQVVAGSVEDCGSRLSGTVLACTSRLKGDAAIIVEPVPKEMKTGGIITGLRDLSREIIEMRVQVAKPVPYLPGQYVKLAVGAGPERDLCPTLSLDGLRELDELIFHVRPAHAGLLRDRLKTGARVKISGPFGRAFLRQGHGAARDGRIVLVASTVGFAPIWSIAIAARLGQPDRPLVLVLSARDPRNLYMRPALDWLAKHDVTEIILTASGAIPMPPARHGRASEQLPALLASDTVHVAGDPAMCAAIQRAAHQAGAACHAMPFLAAHEGAARPGFGQAISRLFSAREPRIARPSAAMAGRKS
jgi:3-phenylpropionate/trans-cinnamate dioxygenase ferredoxin reductase subunit